MTRSQEKTAEGVRATMPVLEKGKSVQKPVAVPQGGGAPAVNKLSDVWERTVGFLRDVRGELRKVVTPSRAEVRATTTVVIVTVFVFAAYFWVVDSVIGRGINYVLHQLGGSQ